MLQAFGMIIDGTCQYMTVHPAAKMIRYATLNAKHNAR